MIMDFLEIRKNIIEWAKTYSGIAAQGQHVWMNQNAPQPPLSPYVGLNITSGPMKVGNNDSRIFDPNDNKFYVTGIRTFNLDVNVYGHAALDIATDLALSIELPDVQDFFRSKNMTFYGSRPNVMNISELLDTIIEDRAMFELTFMAAYIIGTEVPYIQTVELQGENDLETDKFLVDIGG